MNTEGKIITLRKIGVPYPYDFEFDAVDSAKAQAKTVAADLATTGMKGIDANKEIIALIAYLQRLGTDIKKMPVADLQTPTK